MNFPEFSENCQKFRKFTIKFPLSSNFCQHLSELSQFLKTFRGFSEFSKKIRIFYTSIDMYKNHRRGYYFSENLHILLYIYVRFVQIITWYYH